MKAAIFSVAGGLLAFVMSASTINHGLLDSSLPAGPGLTLDESFNIGQGVFLYESVAEKGPWILDPTQAVEIFETEGYLPDHPPLGRFVLGLAHQCTAGFVGGQGDSLFNVVAARLGSSAMFGLTVCVLIWLGWKVFDAPTAVLAAVLLITMPRVLGHSRIASLETATSLFWLASLVPLALWWTGKEPPTTKQAIISGLVWGLLLLTKVQGVLLPPLVFVWAVVQYRHRAVIPLVAWTLAGGALFFVLWPWLWLDPWLHAEQYLGRTTNRLTLWAWYLGDRHEDKQVPWHYPFVIALTTIPVATLLGFVLQLARGRWSRVEILLVAASVWPMLLFALPGTPVYDGSRLFLIVMPSLAMVAARGYLALWNSDALGTRGGRGIGIVALGCVVALSVPDSFGRNGLCYFNMLAGTAAGAEAIGQEADYWATSLNGDFWEQVPEDSTVYVAPVSHQFQLRDLQKLVPLVSQRGIRLEAFDYDAPAKGLVLFIHRLADLRPALRSPPEGSEVVAEARYRGVVLAQLVDASECDWKDVPDWP